MLSILTYGSFVILIVLPARAGGNIEGYHRYIKVIKVFIIIQSALGIMQVLTFVTLHGMDLDLSAGDMAQGTLNILSFIDAGGNFNNQIFTNNLIMLLVFYTPFALAERRGIWVSFIGFAAVLMASVWHLSIAFAIATMLTVLYFSGSILRLSASRIAMVCFLILLAASAYVIQPKNFSLISYYFNKAINFESPKAIVTKNSLTELPNEFPWSYVTGLGPGQFSSRAGLIGSGKYFGEFKKPTPLPILDNMTSKAFDKFVYPKWEEVATDPATYGNSTMSRPFYSALSILVEFGGLIFVLITITVFLKVRRLRRAYREALLQNDKQKAFYAMACCLAIIHMVFIAFFENYLEVAHAVFIGIVLIKYFYARVTSEGMLFK